MSHKMSQYATWVKANMGNSKTYYKYWKDDYTFIRYVRLSEIIKQAKLKSI